MSLLLNVTSFSPSPSTNAYKNVGQKLSPVLFSFTLKLICSQSFSNTKSLHEPRYLPNHKRVLPPLNSGISFVLQVLLSTSNSIHTLYPPQSLLLCVVNVRFLIVLGSGFSGSCFSGSGSNLLNKILFMSAVQNYKNKTRNAFSPKGCAI